MNGLLVRLAVDLACAGLVAGIYFRLYRNREYVFTYFVFNLITFCLCFLLGAAPMHFGIALALFGIFGILRYRTEQIRIRDLTYLFIMIGLGVLNGVAGQAVGLRELLVVECVILGMIALLELGPFGTSERTTHMFYDQLELLRPENETRLLEDIGTRTGLTVRRVEVQRVDLLRDAAEILIFHRPARNRSMHKNSLGR